MTRTSLPRSNFRIASRFALTVALASALLGCSSATLIGATIDLASFVPAANRTQTLPIVALTPLMVRPIEDNDAVPTNGFLVETPLAKIDVIEGLNAQFDLALTSSTQTEVKVGVFIAPITEPNVYQPKFAVTSVDSSLAAGESGKVSLKLDLESGSPFSSALAEVRKGKFRIGLELNLSAGSVGSVTITLDRAKLGVAGYPAKLLTR
jgi:hypothetical protein